MRAQGWRAAGEVGPTAGREQEEGGGGLAGSGSSAPDRRAVSMRGTDPGVQRPSGQLFRDAV